MENTVQSTRVLRNVRWTKRDYESTNIVACVLPEGVQCPPVGAWVDADDSILKDLTRLWIERENIEIWGYL